MWPFSRKESTQDWAKFFGGNRPATRKQRLLEECKKLGVPIYIDDPAEASSGFYADLRGVASEVELDRRLGAKKAISQSARANLIAFVALVVSIIALVVSLW